MKEWREPRRTHATTALLALPSQTALVLAYYRHVSTSDSASYSQDVTLLRTAYTLKWESEQ